MKILVIGDSCTDVWVYGCCERVCPEAPVPVFLPEKTVANDGMAGNVSNNVRAFGHECDEIVSDGKITKTRYIDSKTSQMIMRLDENDFTEQPYGCDAEKLKGYDAIIISDYGKGFLSEENMAFISKSAECLTFLQTNKILSEWCFGMDFIKINELEHRKTVRLLGGIDEDIHDKLIVTLGERGCRYKGRILPVRNKVKVKSLAGAGDTFLAALAVSYAGTRHIGAALDYAQECASRVVQEPGVVTP